MSLLVVRLEDLAAPGPVRSRVLAAMTAELRMSIGLCPDRGRVIAGQLLDRAVTTLRTPA